jgi:hypothetical protein
VTPAAPRACDHRERVDGVCVECGDCTHEVILNGACLACGTTEIDGVARSPKPAALIAADALARKKPR